jgi:dethiobiotin synthetase
VAALFVTATGTDIGKTFVTAGLIRALQARGRAVDALKPVVTGFDMAMAQASDPGILLTALGRAVTEAEIAKLSLWRFAAPLSPDLAAGREGRALDFDALVHLTRYAIDAALDVLLVEGVGGIMVPLDQRHTVLDWMTALQVPVLLVAGSYLGTISHTLSAVDVLQRRDLEIAAIVVSESAGSTVPLDDTVATIARFVPALAVYGMPRQASASVGEPIFDRLADLL